MITIPQRYRQTDRQTTCLANTALRYRLRAVKIISLGILLEDIAAGQNQKDGGDLKEQDCIYSQERRLASLTHFSDYRYDETRHHDRFVLEERSPFRLVALMTPICTLKVC